MRSTKRPPDVAAPTSLGDEAKLDPNILSLAIAAFVRRMVLIALVTVGEQQVPTLAAPMDRRLSRKDQDLARKTRPDLADVLAAVSAAELPRYFRPGQARRFPHRAGVSGSTNMA